MIPKDRSQLFRERIKQLFKKKTTFLSLHDQLRRLNPMLRGWANFYRHAWGAKKVFASLDHYVWWTIARWLCKKHDVSLQRLLPRYTAGDTGCRGTLWCHEGLCLFLASSVCVEQYKLGWMHEPDFAKTIDGEPGA